VICTIPTSTARTSIWSRCAAAHHLRIPGLVFKPVVDHDSTANACSRAFLRLGLGISLPAISTVHAVLDRHGLVSRGRRHHHYKAEGTRLSRPERPNELWCADYKGEFVLADHRYCYPLTITDFSSR
jgi:hypothetical protein